MSDIVFGIGMPLTGNRRLAELLGSLGYKVRIGAEWNPEAAMGYLAKGDQQIMADCLRDGHDAWVGWPVVCYDKLWNRYPDAKFVLTNPREIVTWCKAWAEERDRQVKEEKIATPLETVMTAYLFGSHQPSTAHAEAKVVSHARDAASFLRARKAALLEVDLSARGGDRRLRRFVKSKVVEATPEADES